MEEKNLLPYEALRAGRLQNGLTIRQLADILDVSGSLISDVERGRKNLARRHYGKLPQPIRRAVVEAEIDRLWRDIVELRHQHGISE